VAAVFSLIPFSPFVIAFLARMPSWWIGKRLVEATSD